MIKCIVFDIGRTLMEYIGMPNVWTDYYQTAFEFADKKLNLNLSSDDIKKAAELMRQCNPSVNYREEEILPETIFSDIKNQLGLDVDTDTFISAFFGSFDFKAKIYDETVSVLKELKKRGVTIATLTDVATGMPDELHKSYFSELLPFFDMYVSSSNCGFRKPNPKGLADIANRFSLKSDEMLFVGDEQKDIKVAENFGCKSVLINRKNDDIDYNQTYTVTDLLQLLYII